MTLLTQMRVINSGGGIAVAEVGAVCVVIWREAVVRYRFEKQRQGLADVVERHPEGAGFLCIVEPTAAPPDEELRKASTDMIASHGDRLKCVAGVIEGTGFKAAVTRSVLSGITLLVPRRNAPVSYFAKVDEAAPWISQYVPIDIPQFVVAVEGLRKRLAPAERKLA